jgi:hypothetical protein
VVSLIGAAQRGIENLQKCESPHRITLRSKPPALSSNKSHHFRQGVLG